jgi:hypothetical protein
MICTTTTNCFEHNKFKCPSRSYSPIAIAISYVVALHAKAIGPMIGPAFDFDDCSRPNILLVISTDGFWLESIVFQHPVHEL